MADIQIMTSERMGKSVLTALTVIGRAFLRSWTSPTVNQETRVISHIDNEDLAGFKIKMRSAKVGYDEGKQPD